jgi:hypothetical protein
VLRQTSIHLISIIIESHNGDDATKEGYNVQVPNDGSVNMTSQFGHDLYWTTDSQVVVHRMSSETRRISEFRYKNNAIK